MRMKIQEIASEKVLTILVRFRHVSIQASMSALLTEDMNEETFGEDKRGRGVGS